MDNNLQTLFTLGLNLSKPWQVVKVEFSQVEGAVGQELHIWLDFEKGYRFLSSTGAELTAYDTVEKTWRHLNFFQHACYLHARVPRLRSSGGEIETVSVPWARKNSGFTLLFEAYTMALVQEEMPMNAVARQVKETAPRLWRVFNHWVEKKKGELNLSEVRYIGVDETSRRKGYKYITQFVDLEKRSTIFVCEGKSAETFSLFANWLHSHGGNSRQIELVAMDMSAGFTAGCLQYLPNAQIVYDKFHLIQDVNKALDTVRRAEHKEKHLLKGQRYTLLHLRKHLSARKGQELDTLLLTFPLLGEAYSLREGLVEALNWPNRSEGLKQFLRWLELAKQSTLVPFKKVANFFQNHLFGIRTYFEKGAITNGLLEALNAKIQLAKRRARGFANIQSFINMIYYINGGENFAYPLKTL